MKSPKELYEICVPKLKNNPHAVGDSELILNEELTGELASLLIIPYGFREAFPVLLNEADLRELADWCLERMKRMSN